MSLNIKINQQGIGLIEVMVALLLLSVSVLGFVALQTNSLKATSESLERTQSLVLMREIAEKVRANPTAIETYKEKINEPSKSEPKNCATVNQACNNVELANYDSYQITKQMSQYGFTLGIDHCPNTGGTGADSKRATYSYCLITAWGDTTPTYGDDGDVNCLKNNGSYHTKATCMFMELT